MHSSCPNRDELASFSLGKLPDERSDEFARHLDNCPDCRAAMETLGDAGDTVAASLRLKVPENPFAQEPECRQALAFIEDIARSEGAVNAPVRQPLPMIRDYRLLEAIGHGGMGRVYRAEHARLKRVVALKLLPESRLKEAQAVARFAREVEAVGRLEHPNIVGAMDAGEHDGLHYLAMEYVPGLDLSQLVHRHGPLAAADACEVARQVAVGLQHAHEHGLIHRDIKPSNLMLTPAGQVKILDLGLALFDARPDVEHSELTGEGQLMGTVDYMAPEQADDSHVVDIRADIYSLGATLYKLLCGLAPFDSNKYETPVRRIAALLTHAPRPITEHRPEIPAELAAVVHQMLARDPHQRYATPAEAAAALEPWAAGADLAGLARQFPPRPSDGGSGVTARSTDHFSRSVGFDTDAPLPEPSSAAPTVSLPARNRAQPHAVTARPRRSVLASVAFGLALLGIASAGVFAVRIATDKGELVIESAEPNVEITIRRNGQPIDELELTRGRNQTRLRSGGYEIVLAGPNTDGLRIENNRFTLTRGGEAIVRITRLSSATPKSDANAKSTAEAPAKQPEAWPLGPAENVLPGLIPRPTKLPGVPRWQIETITPRGGISSSDWSPDGKWIAFGISTGDIRVYDAETLQLVRLFLGHGGPVRCVDWDPSGQHLASAAEDKTVRLWNADGAPGPVLTGHSGLVYSVAWSPDGKRLASGSQDLTVRIWTSDGTLEKTLKGHKSNVYAVAWSPDGQWLASGGNDHQVRLWQPDGKPGRVWEHEHRVQRLSWTPDSSWLAYNSGKTIRLRKPDGTEGPLLEGHLEWIDGLAWGADGKTLAYAGGNRWGLLNLDGSAGPLHSDPEGGGGNFNTMTRSPDGKRIATGSWRGRRIVIWGEDGERQTVLGRETEYAWSLAWKADASMLASGYAEAASVRVWRPDGTLDHFLPANEDVQTLAWRPGSSELATGGGWRILRIWDAQGNAREFRPVHEGDVAAVAWSPDGELIATGSHNWKGPQNPTPVRVWREDGSLHLTLEGHGGQIQCVAWSPDGARLAAGGDDRTIRIWERDGTPGPVLTGHDSPVMGVAWSPDGTKLVSAGYDGTLRLWQATGEAGPVLPGHTDIVHTIAWSPNGRWIASAGRGGSVRLWGESGRAGPRLHGHVGEVSAVAWRPDGEALASAGGDATIIFWNGRSGEPERVAVSLTEDRSVTFTAAGEFVAGDSEDYQQEFVYALEQSDGRLELLKPSEFQQRFRGSIRRARDASADDSASEVRAAAEFMRRVAALPPEQQVQTVAERLKELNPGFDGVVKHVIRGGAVVELEFLTDRITDISPVRALTQLSLLHCQGSEPGRGRLRDVSPLQGMTLTRFGCQWNPIRDLSPLGGMPLTALNIRETRVSDLTPLAGMPLTWLSIFGTPIDDLTPLKGMPLVELDGRNTQIPNLAPLAGMPLQSLLVDSPRITDLSPLKGAPLTTLQCGYTRVADLSPLAESPLAQLWCENTLVSDLTPLKGLPLTRVHVNGTRVSDLSPLRGMKLTNLSCNETQVTDLSPLRGMPLIALDCDGSPIADFTPLRDMPIEHIAIDVRPYDEAWRKSLESLPLTTINRKPAEQFWQEVTARQGEDEAFNRRVAVLPSEEQVQAVAARLKELNSGFDGKVEHAVDDGKVVELRFSAAGVSDLTPVRSLSGLKRLACVGMDERPAPFVDLSPLAGLGLEELACHERLLRFNAPVLRKMASLKTINGRAAAEALHATKEP